MKIPPKKNLFSQYTAFLVVLYLSFLFGISPSPLRAESPVDRMIEATKNGEMSQPELADSLLSLAEVNQLAIENPEILVLRFPGFVEIMGEKLKARVVVHLQQGTRDSLNQLTAFAERMLGTQSSYTKQVRRLVELGEKYEELVSRGTVDSAAAFSAQLSTELERRLFKEKLEQFILRTVERKTNHSTPFKSIENLMELGKVSQPKELVTNVKKLLQTIEKRARAGTLDWSQSSLEQPQVEQFLSSLTARDETFSTLLRSIKEQRALQFAKDNKFSEARELFKDIVRSRPDPNPANTVLRKQLLFSLKGERAGDFADQLLQPLLQEDELSFSEKWKLYQAGYYGRGTLLTVFLGLFGLFIVVVLAIFLLGRLIPGLSPEQLVTRWQAYRRDRLVRKNERRGVGYTSAVEGEDQYSLLLKQFGLDDSATDADIKKAYRAMVKELHPDAHGASGKVLDEQGNVDRSFEELKQNYKRLMEMRSSFFSKS